MTNKSNQTQYFHKDIATHTGSISLKYSSQHCSIINCNSSTLSVQHFQNMSMPFLSPFLVVSSFVSRTLWDFSDIMTPQRFSFSYMKQAL